MSDNVVNAANSLDALAVALVNGWSDDRTFAQAWGWNHPPLNRHDLADMARRLANRIRELSPAQLDEDLASKLGQVPDRVAQFTTASLPYLYNGNAFAAYPVYSSLISWVGSIIQAHLPPEVDWADIESRDLMPRALLRRLRSVDTQITNVEGRTENLTEKIQVIEEAHAAAESLPTDLKELEEARAAVDSARKSAEAHQASAAKAETKSAELVAKMRANETEAAKLIKNCEDAYSAATTKGLGESFAERAKRLAGSMWVWVAVLMVSLATGAVLSLLRLAALRKVLEDSTPNMGLVWVNIVLGILSIAGPVWLAWVATKQIGQRFRLSEDYAFKAAVAKAYEGYRREAARVAEKFAKELFGSAFGALG